MYIAYIKRIYSVYVVYKIPIKRIGEAVKNAKYDWLTHRDFLMTLNTPADGNKRQINKNPLKP